MKFKEEPACAHTTLASIATSIEVEAKNIKGNSVLYSYYMIFFFLS